MIRSSIMLRVAGALLVIALPGLAPLQALAAKKAAQPAPAVEAPSPEALARADNLAILNAIRPETERRLDQGPVRFTVRTLRIQEGYAFVEAHVERPDGSAFGSADGSPRLASAILHKANNSWDVDTLRLGAASPWPMGYCERVPAGLIDDCPASAAGRQN